MASYSPYLAEAMRVPGQDRRFSEAINQRMQVPDRLSIGAGHRSSGEQEEEEEVLRRRRSQEPPAAYSMHIPDRLTYTEALDLNPRPLFTLAKPALCSSPLTLETCWENTPFRDGEHIFSDTLQSAMRRRSYSDQGFGRTPPGTPTHPKHAAVMHAHLSSPRGPGAPLRQRSTVPGPARALTGSQAPPLGLPSLSPYSLLQAARLMGQQASQRLLQAISHKYRLSYPDTPAQVGPAAEASGPINTNQSRKRAMESWSQEDEGGAVVEFIVLRRQVVKMSRRLAGLERQNAERRSTETLLFSLLLSACLLNAWLWVRR